MRLTLTRYSTTGMETLKRNVLLYAVGSRIVFLVFSALANLIVPDHKALDVFSTPVASFESFNLVDRIIYYLAGGLVRWDAHHYLHIAAVGYTYENNLAFFPIYPMCVAVTSLCLKLLFGNTLNTLSLLMLAGVGINFFFFVKASVVMFELTVAVFNDPVFAYRTSVFFCLSPATVFFMAPYTESLFAYLTFKGMLYCFNTRLLPATFWFSLAGCVRSNGLLNVGYITYFLMYRALNFVRSNQLWTFQSLKLLLNTFLCVLGSTVLISLPYISFQFFGFYKFCYEKNISYYPQHVVEYAHENNLTMPSNISDWCEHQFPFPYFTVQKKYWNVGFLRYFDIRQIPNFILAFPMVVLILYNGVVYLQKNFYLFEKSTLTARRKRKTPNTLKLPHSILPHCIHALLLTLYALFFINVQVTTRLLASSSPFIYWVAASQFILYLKNCNKYKKRKINKSWKIFPFGEISLRKQGNLIKFYFLTYIILGITLFSNNYPWT